MLKFILLACPDRSTDPVGADELTWTNVGEVALQVADLIGLRSRSSDEHEDLNRAQTLLLVSELHADTNPALVFGRCQALWLTLSESPTLIKSEHFVPIADRFASYYGVSLRTYIQIIAAIALRIEEFSPFDAYRAGAITIDESSYFSNFNFSKTEIRAVLSDISQTAERFAERIL